MTKRLSLLALAFLTAGATAFAPAPVYREKPDDLLARMLGRWELVGSGGAVGVVITKDSWTFSTRETTHACWGEGTD
jgi:hypothetical protein